MQARGRERHQLQNASFPSLPWNSPEGQVLKAQMQAIITFQGTPNRRLLPLYGMVGWGEGKREGLGVGRDWVKVDLRGSYQKYLGGASVKVPNNEAWNGDNWARNVGVHKSMFGLRDWLGGRRGLSPWPQFSLENCNALAVHQVWCGRGTFPLWGLPGKAL